ncbi:hypothetical protein Hanom_Chr10g00921681 [Helianthus anomalus]
MMIKHLTTIFSSLFRLHTLWNSAKSLKLKANKGGSRAHPQKRAQTLSAKEQPVNK